MGGSSWQIARVRGVPIRVDISWLFIALLLVWNYTAIYTNDPSDRSTGQSVVMAVVTALLFFGSILAHELAHALEAQHRGVHVGSITLFLFGGATESRFDVRRPIDEFALTAVGPFTSFVAAASFGLVSAAADGAGWETIARVAGPLAWINLALGLFNLLPGAPLDGGRILRAVVWKVTGDRARSIRAAGRAGQVLGLTLIGLGILQALSAAAGFIGGLWLALIGWFLFGAARGEVHQARLQSLLTGRTARSLLSPAPVLSAETGLADARSRLWREHHELLLIERNGHLVGYVRPGDLAPSPGADDLRQGPEDISMAGVMHPLCDAPHLDADEPALDALQRLDSTVVAVDDRGETIGVISPDQARHLVERLDRSGRGAPGQPLASGR